MDKVISRTISEIDKVKNENLKLNDKLNRARAEIEQLKADIESRTMCITCERELQNCNLQAENERLKKECTLYDCGNKEWAIEYKKLEDDYTELLDRLDDISYDKSNYYQALQEIRDIVETCLKFHKCEKCKFYKECQCDLEEYILTKINEVIGAEE